MFAIQSLTSLKRLVLFHGETTMKVLRTAFLLTALTLVLLVLGNAFGGPNGMKMALGFAVVMNAFAYFFSDKIALWSSGMRPVVSFHGYWPVAATTL